MIPSVSVVVPAYQSARYVEEAVASVLDQTLSPDEIVVVDDGSTDGTADVVARFPEPVKVLRGPHRGVASAMNRGIAASRGELLAFQDADDVWLPRRLERQIAALREDDTLDAVSGHVETFLSPDLAPELAARYRVPPVTAAYQFYSLLIRRLAFDRVGLIDPRVGTGATIDWVSRARAVGLRTLVLPDVVCRRRIHDSNMTRRTGDRDKELLQVLREHRRKVTHPDGGTVRGPGR